MSPVGEAMNCRFTVALVLAGVVRPVFGDPRDQRRPARHDIVIRHKATPATMERLNDWRNAPHVRVHSSLGADPDTNALSTEFGEVKNASAV